MPIIKEEDVFEREEVMAEINITPLTDVFLVLLVIFMIATPLLVQSGVKVNLPSSEVVDIQPEGIIVTLTEDDKIYLDKQEIGLESLKEKLADKLNKSEEKLVILQGDRKVFLGKAVKIMDIAKMVGADKIAIATEPKEKELTEDETSLPE